MLLDLASTPAKVSCSRPCASESWIVVVLRRIEPGTTSRVCGVATFSSIAAAAVITFAVEPGSKTSSSPRLPRSAAGDWPGRFESNVGTVARASTSPVRASRITATPDSALDAATWAARACWAFHCRSTSMVSRTVWPSCGSTSSVTPVGIATLSESPDVS